MYRGQTAILRDDLETLGREGVALIALGRVERVNAIIDDLVDLPEHGLSQGSWIVSLAAYLRTRGHTDAALATADRAAGWYESRLPETRSSAAGRYHYTLALLVANRCDEAYSIASSLPEEFPENSTYRGIVGLLAACREQQAEALAVSQWLEALDRPHLRGENTWWRSMIAGALGDGEAAVTLWGEAMEGGVYFPVPWSAYWIAFEPVRDYPAFQELIRLKR
jgi:hypothetical protein